ncbi:Hypothetical predicted protein [Cloeon dipterum]|uniref:Cytoplasmic dynein 2 light intermediate chain 1 n=2 Tax=Cloeon dipterum TaxID=197152 RepID=A0A8S1C2I8_9INSE|nr:Hypothetical predicted protein [Cloeon dipterum]
MSAKPLSPEFQSLLDLAISSSKQRYTEKESVKNTVFFIGNKGGGKSTLINLLLDRNENTKPTLAMDYYFARRSSRSLWSDVCHIFELGGGTMYTDLLTAPISTASVEHLTIFLILDLSRPSEMWDTIECVASDVRKLVTTAAKTEYKVSQIKEAAKARLGQNFEGEPFIEPFLVPLVIIGTKYDVFETFDSEKKNVICRCLRFAALSLGASLYFSTTKDAAVLKKIREMLVVQSFETQSPKYTCQDVSKPLAIPCGKDSVQLIGGPGTTVNFKNSVTALTRWKQTCMALYPNDEKATVAIDVDPTRDPNYFEPEIDSLREQKDVELDKYKQQVFYNRRRDGKKEP